MTSTTPSGSHVRFITPDTPGVTQNLRIKLDFISIFMGSMTVSSALLFNGRVDIDRFAAALKHVGNACPYLFGAMQPTTGDHPAAVYVVPRVNEEFPAGYVSLEFVDLGASTPYLPDTVSVNSLLPQHVHEKMTSVANAMFSLDELPIAAFRITQFASHFVLGYRLNHMFFDQGGVVSLLRSLASAYKADAPVADAPPFLPRVLLAPEDKQFASPDEFASATPKGYNTNPLEYTAGFAPPSSDVTFTVDSAAVDALRRVGEESQTPLKLSSNDFIHALLLKALIQSLPTEDDDKPVRIMFARNMRKLAGVDERVHGDYVRTQQFSILGSDARRMSLTELALGNRRQLDDAYEKDLEEFKKEVMWFRDFRAFGNEGFPNCDFHNDPRAVMVTNWSSFPYQDIRFFNDNEAQSGARTLLVEKPTSMFLLGGFAIVGFDHPEEEGGARRLVVNVVTRNNAFSDSLKALVAESVLSTKIS